MNLSVEAVQEPIIRNSCNKINVNMFLFWQIIKIYINSLIITVNKDQ
jgi:hypothetical protein